MTGSRITPYDINENLPSLNRGRGTIYLPAGRYFVHGTIRLFSGQQLLGTQLCGEGSFCLLVPEHEAVARLFSPARPPGGGVTVRL